MKLESFFLSALLAFSAFATIPAAASEGPLDENGCHYERGHQNYHCHKNVGPNPDRLAPVKKTRDNVCYDKKSPNYRMAVYFVGYRSMADCVMSGGDEYVPTRSSGGLSDRYHF
jgi:hypothetical protein